MNLPYDPGPLPSLPPPNAGDTVEFEVDGWPPWKDVSASIRNANSRQRETFTRLRAAAITAMRGRAWYSGPVALDVDIHCHDDQSRRGLVDYIGGIMDTLGGCHGFTFTYLPIIYEDDAQVCSGKSRFVDDVVVRYSIRARFLHATEQV